MRRPSYAAVVAHVALAVALSGGAMAAVTITGADIKPGTITGKNIKPGSLTGTAFKKNSVALDRLSRSLPQQYYSRSQSNARFLAKDGTATRALTADSAGNATNATNAVNATTAASATNALQLGGLPPSSYAQGRVSFLANRLDVALNDTTLATVLDVPGFAHVIVLNCQSGLANVEVENPSGGSGSTALFYQSSSGGTGGVGSGWFSINSPSSSSGALSVDISSGTGSTTRVAHLELKAYQQSAGCTYIATAAIYG